MRQKTNRIVGAIVLISVFVLGLLIGLTIWEMNQCRNSFLEWEESEQEAVCDNLKDKMESFLETKKDVYRSRERLEEGLISEVLNPLSAGNKQYYIVFHEDNLIFYQNEELSSHRAEYTKQDLWLEYSKNGGENLETLQKQVDMNKSGSVRFRPSENQDECVAFVRSFDLDSETYTILYVENAKWLLKQAGIQKFVVLLLVELVLCGAILVAGACTAAALYRKKDCEVEVKNREIERKNNLISHLNKKLYPEDESNEWYGNCKDEASGVYNEEFAENLIASLDARNILNVHIAVFSAKIAKKDKNFGWRKIAEEFEKNLGKGQTLIMLDPRHMAAVSLKQFREEFEAQMTHCIRKVEREFDYIKLHMEMKICSRQKEEDSLVASLQKVMNDELGEK